MKLASGIFRGSARVGYAGPTGFLAGGIARCSRAAPSTSAVASGRRALLLAFLAAKNSQLTGIEACVLSVPTDRNPFDISVEPDYRLRMNVHSQYAASQ